MPSSSLCGGKNSLVECLRGLPSQVDVFSCSVIGLVWFPTRETGCIIRGRELPERLGIKAGSIVILIGRTTQTQDGVLCA